MATKSHFYTPFFYYDYYVSYWYIFFLIGEKKNDRKGNEETGNARKENGGIGKDVKGNAKKKPLGISSAKIKKLVFR